MINSDSFKLKIKLQIKSLVCNLIVDEMRRQENDAMLLRAQRRAAYEAWIDSIPSRFEYEKTYRNDRDTESPSPHTTEEIYHTQTTSQPPKNNFFAQLAESNKKNQFCELNDTIELSTDGEVVYENGKYSIIYDESVLLDTNCKTIIEFSSQNPQRISIYRTGNNDASLVFDADLRRIMCMYETFAGQIAMCVITHNIINTVANLRDNGKADLIMDYTLEMNSIKTEYTHYEMSLSAVNDERETPETSHPSFKTVKL